MRCPQALDFILFASLLATLTAGTPAVAQDQDDTSKDACRHAYENSQLLRRNGELLAAREQLRVCGGEACPAVARVDCVLWLGEVEADIPSVVFEARTDAGVVFDVTVKVDGQVLTTRLDGRPVAIDPGFHVLTFERAVAPAIEQRILLRAGEKNLLVVADWATPKRPEPAHVEHVERAERVDRPVPSSVYATAVLAALGFADFAIAGLVANGMKSDLEASGCAPVCSSDKVNTMRAGYVVADIGLAVGAAELATSAFLLLTRPERVTSPKVSQAPVAGTTWRGGASQSGAFVTWFAFF